MMNKDPRAQTRICQKEMTDREEAVKPKNPCNKMQFKLVGKTTGHRQEEHPASLDFNIFSDLENNADTLETTEPADEGIASAYMEMKRNLPESSSPGNSRNNDQRILMESPRRRKIEASARVPFLGTLPEEEWEVHRRDHESRTGCKLDRVAFMEEIWTVVQSYGTQSENGSQPTLDEGSR